MKPKYSLYLDLDIPVMCPSFCQTFTGPYARGKPWSTPTGSPSSTHKLLGPESQTPWHIARLQIGASQNKLALSNDITVLLIQRSWIKISWIKISCPCLSYSHHPRTSPSKYTSERTYYTCVHSRNPSRKKCADRRNVCRHLLTFTDQSLALVGLVVG